MKRATVLLALLAAAGCGIHFPDPTQIQDLRVLEIRTDPPEMTAIAPGHTATTAQQLLFLLATDPNEQQVTASAIITHPDLGATFGYAWTRCKPFDTLPCDPPLRVPLVTETSSTVSFSPIDALRMDVAGAG